MPFTYSNTDFAQLRDRAEKWLKQNGDQSLPKLQIDDVMQLNKELQTHVIELELQNEDLRLAQSDLVRSQKRYACLYNFAPAGYLTIKQTGLICEANFTIAEMLGLTRHELLGYPFFRLIHDKDQKTYQTFRKMLMISSKKQRCELRVFKADGSLLHVLLEGKINLDIDGNSEDFRATIIDISDRKVLETRLLQSRDEWCATFDAMDDGVVLLDEHCQVLRANRAAQTLLEQGLDPGEGALCHKILYGSDGHCCNCPGTSPDSEEIPATATTTLDKSGKTLLISCSSLAAESRTPARVILVIKDITIQKQIERELLQSQKMEALGTLAGGIAHDFNNILTAILGYADIVCATKSVPEESRNHAQEIVQAAHRAKELIRQIRSFSHKEQLTKSPLDISPVIKEAMKLMRASIPVSVAIRENVAPDCGLVLANPINIHQIIVNLCTNAVHAMGEKRGVLTISLRKALPPTEFIPNLQDAGRAYVELQVTDTGCGIEQDAIHHIFEPYFTTKNFELGSGIGLAVVKSIVSNCGGFIHVESEPDSGTTFRVYLPIILDASANDTPVRKTDAPRGNERILVVDDETSIVNLYALALNQLGYTVIGHTSSEEALQCFQKAPHDYDLVITDYSMPQLSGLDLTSKLLELRPELPVLICTGYQAKMSRQEMLKLGVAQVLTKPISRMMLAETIREIFDEKK
ncbi:PAS domain-containing hybrid sensor histidine kinase/response regulator [Desulfopila aestuarii]|uniref:histidine kinase n=1 Tax=Desulfopila aestuarii DSM 18488 TaxID=1121416 RepID=A0A1M7Y5V0_9BACT|nr:PAS domain-containing sensor histidine kinase [Desulfopila aestuarii]SHO47741.1 PAS domain S-box-containing protein [Desulfopila aestuarii DSM 18488]